MNILDGHTPQTARGIEARFGKSDIYAFLAKEKWRLAWDQFFLLNWELDFLGCFHEI